VTVDVRDQRKLVVESMPERYRGLLILFPALAALLVPVSLTAAPVAADTSRAEADPGLRSGAIVQSIELRADAPLVRPRDLMDLVEIETGAPLSSSDVRRTLLNLRVSGIVGAAEVRQQATRSGVHIVVAIFPKLRVSSLAVEGELCVRRSTLESRLQQIEATPLSESRVLRGVYRLQDHLVEQGFRDAQVRLAVDVRPEQREANVRYVVECGEPTVVGSLSFEGDLGPYSRDLLMDKLRVVPGKRLERGKVKSDARRLQEWLLKAGYWLATVDEPLQHLEPGSSSASLLYKVNVGPRFELSFDGGDADLLRRKKLFSLLEQQRFDEALLEHVLGGIRRFYQERGHYGVEATWQMAREPEVVRLRISIRKGPVSTIAAVSFQGNEVVTAEELRERMSTGPPAVFGASGFLVSDQLEDDLANIRSHYARRGFPDASVGPAQVRRENQSLFVDIPIEEGPQHRLVDLVFVGVDDESVLAALADLTLVSGGPFHSRLLEETLDEIRAAYEDAGYLSAQVSVEATSDPVSPLQSLEIRVMEGPQVRVGRIILRGNAATHSNTVRRSLGMESGDIISRRALLDAQRRLYRLGIFSRAEVRLAPTRPFAPERDILVRVEEGRRQRVTFGLGYDSEDGLRSLLGYSHSNLGGRAVSTRIDLRVSEREEQFRALLRQPFLGPWPIPVTYSLFAVEEEKESFDSRRRGTQVEGHRSWKSSRVGLLYTYKTVDVVERPDVPLFTLGIDRNFQESDISSLTPSVLFDRRDDPLIPTRGWTLNLQTEVAFPLLSADAEYLKLFGQGTLYLPLGRPGVIATSFRLGAIEPIDASSDDIESLVPISEQFFAGGRTTHRAYRRDLLGVLGETILLCRPGTGACGGEVPVGEDPADYVPVAAGGNGLLLFNIDYRFPVAGPLGGTLFVDAGNVWANWQDVGFGELKIGAGLGLRYLSPIGPLRLEVGWKLDRERGESPSVIFLSFGNPF
jgi:outer membrane protein assembly complex protein YaeT